MTFNSLTAWLSFLPFSNVAVVPTFGLVTSTVCSGSFGSLCVATTNFVLRSITLSNTTTFSPANRVKSTMPKSTSICPSFVSGINSISASATICVGSLAKTKTAFAL